MVRLVSDLHHGRLVLARVRERRGLGVDRLAGGDAATVHRFPEAAVCRGLGGLGQLDDLRRLVDDVLAVHVEVRVVHALGHFQRVPAYQAVGSKQ